MRVTVPNRAKVAPGTTTSFPRRCPHPALAAQARGTPDGARNRDPLDAKTRVFS